ncbi:Insulin-like growth factor binding protein, N-terminal [Pseudocohnilembus persalinus]|uniref:Insulin-like growth factor binding protein, N-terminal n=1 Tax=Pseudocohnilembus persalinus TaxID=266149 RepID=A0A0V0QVQ7_PSEPJ|nr:Insulin-like growth factor binding protein, N-terminal [Pseudocohnilembus persalinus]|eukprot:KRX06173.1 Insulin-like growth factor binding protein, N-terminal [Pseudocohnilembus persalinus]
MGPNWDANEIFDWTVTGQKDSNMYFDYQCENEDIYFGRFNKGYVYKEFQVQQPHYKLGLLIKIGYLYSLDTAFSINHAWEYKHDQNTVKIIIGAQNNQAVTDEALVGYVKENQVCVKKCIIENCEDCSADRINCELCESDYLLIHNTCVKKCPFFTTQNETHCIDTYLEDNESRRYVGSDFLKDDFNHFDVLETGWEYNKFQLYQEYNYNNLAGTYCESKKYALGRNFDYKQICDNCKFTKIYETTQNHRILKLNMELLQGDYCKNLQNKNYENNSNILVSQTTDLCGALNPENDTKYFDSIHEIQESISHNKQQVELKIEWNNQSGSFDQFLGIRDIVLYTSDCIQQCETCKEENSCLTCVGSQEENFSRQLPFCDCPAGYYSDLSVQNDCMPCRFGCATCSNGNECDSCVQSEPARVGTLCECPGQRYFDDGINNQCQACVRGCATCQNIDKCESCLISNPERILEEFCACVDEYYDDNLNDQCQECQWPCVTCDDENTCKTCVSEERNVSKKCGCPDGFYDDFINPQCQKCQRKCQKCENGENCLVCKDSIPKRNESDCECPDGYYDDQINKNCQKCDPKCKTCNVENICLVCLNPQFLEPNCVNQKLGHFLDTFDDQIFDNACEKKCSYCVDEANNCTGCSEGENRLKLDENCVCKLGYHDFQGKNKDCQKCPNFCLECISDKICTKCEKKENLILNYNGQCVCKLGYKWNNLSQKCEKCYLYKNSCYLKCSDSTLQDEQLFACAEMNVSQQQNFKIFYICAGLFIVCMLLGYLILKQRLNFSLQRIQYEQQSDVEQS